MDQFMRPIPGQSLTDIPKNSPWERPPEIVDVGEVVKYYIQKLADEDVMDDLAITFEMGADLESIVETMMLTGSMKGVHTVEAGMLAGPVIGTFITQAMSSYGVDVKQSIVDPKEAKKQKGERRLRMILKEYMQRTDVEQDEGYELISDMAEAADVETEAAPEEPQVEEQPMEQPAEQPQGLMAKGE